MVPSVAEALGPDELERRGCMNLVERGTRKFYKWSSSVFCRRMLHVHCDPPIVSFSFDDFPQSAAVNGANVLEEIGIRATYFVSFGLTGRSLSSGPGFTLDDVTRLLDSGHELGCHTFGHERAQRVARRQYKASIERNETRARELMPNCPWQVFAYPFGSITPGTKHLVQERFLCGRSIRHGINAGWTDVNQLRSTSLCTVTRPVSHHIALVEKAKLQHGWLIYHTHDVQDEPSRFGCTSEYLRAVAQAAVDSGAAVMPIGQAMDEIQSHATERAVASGNGA